MKDVDGRWQNRIMAAVGAGLRRPRLAGAGLRRPRLAAARATAGGPASPAGSGEQAEAPIKTKIGTAAFAFRGYDVSNLGRSGELLARPDYGPVVREALAEASAIAADTLRRPVDLAAYVEAAAPTSLGDFAEDVAMIVAIELAQIRLLEKFFDVPAHEARLSVGYSIGELSALVFGGTFRLDQLLPIPLALAEDCAELAADTTMGILFTRGPELPPADVERLCTAISAEGRGLVGPSSYLSPNTALLLGQGDTLDRLEKVMRDYLPEKVMLRRNPHKWPPLHTPLVWQRNIPNRTAVAVYKIPGTLPGPRPKVLSGVTGDPFDAEQARDLLIKWTDHPQRLWDTIDGILANGTETVVHVGPSPNLIPATFHRLANNVNKHLGNKYLRELGRNVASSMSRYAWLAHVLPSQAALLRAPFLEHVILEDWLLEQPVS